MNLHSVLQPPLSEARACGTYDREILWTRPMSNQPSPPGRYNLLLLWVIGSALWVAAMLIYTAYTRPAPGFALMGPLTLGVPLAALSLGLAARYMTRPRR
jgi:hypothetical protein